MHILTLADLLNIAVKSPDEITITRAIIKTRKQHRISGYTILDCIAIGYHLPILLRLWWFGQLYNYLKKENNE